MKLLYLASIFLFYTTIGCAQTEKFTFKDLFKPRVDSAIVYPIYGFFEIDGGGSNYKNIVLKIYDKNNKLIYDNIQSVPTAEIFHDLIPSMLDPEYKKYMMRHGLVLINKRP